MKIHKLIFLRHAEAAAAPLTGQDRNRALTEKGRMQAEKVGRDLAGSSLDLHLAHLWFSPALRTKETATILCQVLPDDVAPQPVDALYDIAGPALLEMLRNTPEDTRTLIIVGHNPTIGELCRELAGEDIDAPEFDRLTEGYPPATATVFHITSDWMGLSTDTAKLVAIFHP